MKRDVMCLQKACKLLKTGVTFGNFGLEYLEVRFLVSHDYWKNLFKVSQYSGFHNSTLFNSSRSV